MYPGHAMPVSGGILLIPGSAALTEKFIEFAVVDPVVQHAHRDGQPAELGTGNWLYPGPL